MEQPELKRRKISPNSFNEMGIHFRPAVDQLAIQRLENKMEHMFGEMAKILWNIQNAMMELNEKIDGLEEKLEERRKERQSISYIS